MLELERRSNVMETTQLVNVTSQFKLIALIKPSMRVLQDAGGEHFPALAITMAHAD